MKQLTRQEVEVELRKKIGANIKKLRKLNGMSQTELAKLVGHSSAAYIAFIENGNRSVSATDLFYICEALGVHISDIFGNINSTDYTAIRGIRDDIGLSTIDKKYLEKFYLCLKS